MWCLSVCAALFCVLQEMRILRREILYLCKHRMENGDHGNVDALVVLLHKMRNKVVIRKLASSKRKSGRLLRDALKVILETVHLLKGREGAAGVIYSAFSGRAGSALMRQLTKMFESTLTFGERPLQQQQQQSDSGYGGRRFNSGPSGYKRRFRPAKPFDRKSDVCYECGEVGHMGRECSKAQ